MGNQDKRTWLAAQRHDAQRKQTNSDSVVELMHRIRAAGDASRDSLSRSHEQLYCGLADAVRLAELLRDDDAWRRFTAHPYFKKCPERDDPLMAVILFMLSASSLEQRQTASRHRQALRYFLGVLGNIADELVGAIHALKGGLAQAAALYAEHLRQNGKNRRRAGKRAPTGAEKGGSPDDTGLSRPSLVTKRLSCSTPFQSWHLGAGAGTARLCLTAAQRRDDSFQGDDA